MMSCKYRFELILSLLIYIASNSSCKSFKDRNLEAPPYASEDHLTSDRASDEPIGIPGYKMDCQIKNLPFSLDLTFKSKCFIIDDKGNFLDATFDITQIETNNDVNLLKIIQTHDIEFTLQSILLEKLLTEFNNLQVKATIPNLEAKALSFNQIIAPKIGIYKTYAECDSGFSFMITDKVMSTFGSFNKFPDCEDMAKQFYGKEFPGTAPLATPLSVGHRASFSCDLDTLTILVTDAGGTFSTKLSPLEKTSCDAMAAYGNSLGF